MTEETRTEAFEGGGAGSLLEQVESIKAQIDVHEKAAAELRAQLKALRDGLKGLGRGGARKSTSSKPRKPRAPKASASE